MLSIEFDWLPLPDNIYTGAYMNIRKKDVVRNVNYGRTRSPLVVSISAYTLPNPQLFLSESSGEVFTASSYALNKYKILWNVKTKEIDF